MIKCNKRSFKDKKQAERILHFIVNTHDGRKKPVRAYECDICHSWHLTSKPIDEDKPEKYKVKLDWSKIIKK